MKFSTRLLMLSFVVMFVTAPLTASASPQEYENCLNAVFKSIYGDDPLDCRDDRVKYNCRYSVGGQMRDHVDACHYNTARHCFDASVAWKAEKLREALQKSNCETLLKKEEQKGPDSKTTSGTQSQAPGGQGLTQSQTLSYPQFKPPVQSPAPRVNAGSPPQASASTCAAETCSYPPKAVPCLMAGVSDMYTQTLTQSMKAQLIASARAIESGLSLAVNNMVRTSLSRMEEIEQNTLKWWKGMWSYELLPSLKRMASQLSAGAADQTRMLVSAQDAEQSIRTWQAISQAEVRTEAAVRVTESACTLATNAGGLGRANYIARLWREARQNEFNNSALNRLNAAGSEGILSYHSERWERFRKYMCGSQINAGIIDCNTELLESERVIDGDVRPAWMLFERATIDVTKEPTRVALRALMENLTGDPASDAIARGEAGQQVVLIRRSSLARRAALRSVPSWIESVRMPGSGASHSVAALRTASGVKISDLGNNPSYREVMQALTVDRFNSGSFATQRLDTQAQVEREKLLMDTLYLMQLRDYYELLERVALTMAVQTALMIEQEGVPSASMSQPISSQRGNP